MKRQPAAQTRQPAAAKQAAQVLAQKPETVQRRRRKAGGEVQRANSQTELTPEERNRMVATAAYHRAEQRGFEPGHELEDWLAAEAEIKELLGGHAPAAS